ncbi:hypothetical protein [Dyella terrae]|uniref:hypothetical protein n=1 Tax=Dyella terrae TaxID=522259 RepID=UPI001EFC6738|nr:hypothetical protein [Dyella terrae]ULU24084.1 hypothetical protein DYST_00991 [Dyella terrae]
MKSTPSFRKVWGVPLLLSALTLIGLLSALLGEHVVWKTMGWLSLTVPVAAGLWLARPRKEVQRPVSRTF